MAYIFSDIEWFSLATTLVEKRNELREQARRTKDAKKRRDYLSEDRVMASIQQKLERLR